MQLEDHQRTCKPTDLLLNSHRQRLVGEAGEVPHVCAVPYCQEVHGASLGYSANTNKAHSLEHVSAK